MAVNSSGQGYLLISPTLANDAPFAWYTINTVSNGGQATFTTTATGATSTTGVGAVTMSALPYTAAQLSGSSSDNSSVQGRMVSCGVRVWYSGTELNKGGTITAYVDPSHSNLYGETIASIGARREASVCPITEVPYEFSIYGIDSSEYEYETGQYLGNASAATYKLAASFPYSGIEWLSAADVAGSFNNGSAPAIIFFEAAAPNVSFRYEIVAHCEFVGSLAEGKTTVSTADTVGVEIVQNAASHATAEMGSSIFGAMGTSFSEGFQASLVPLARAVGYSIPTMLYQTLGRRRYGDHPALRGGLLTERGYNEL